MRMLSGRGGSEAVCPEEALPTPGCVASRAPVAATADTGGGQGTSAAAKDASFKMLPCPEPRGQRSWERHTLHALREQMAQSRHSAEETRCPEPTESTPPTWAPIPDGDTGSKRRKPTPKVREAHTPLTVATVPKRQTSASQLLYSWREELRSRGQDGRVAQGHSTDLNP